MKSKYIGGPRLKTWSMPDVSTKPVSETTNGNTFWRLSKKDYRKSIRSLENP